MPDPTTPPQRHGSDDFADARTGALEDAADLARLAPSIHNTQPWTLVLGDGRLSLRADRSRQVPAIDPLGRALVESVGAALFNARTAVAAAGWIPEVSRLPRPDDPDLLAEVRPVLGRPDGDLAALARLIPRRHTNRRRFAGQAVPDGVLRRLTELAALEQTELIPMLRDEHRALVARLTQEADGIQNADPSYRAELRRWTTREKATGDGVPPTVVPHIDGQQDDAVPIRDFDTQGAGALPSETHSDADQTLVLLATASDDTMAWLRSGEALQRVLLELTRLGWVASPVTQAIEVPVTRARLRAALTWEAYPQMLLRIGQAAPTTATPRRGRADVVRNSTRPAEPAPVPSQREGRSPLGEDRDQPRPVSDGRGGTIWSS
jgi:nitroreductase